MITGISCEISIGDTVNFEGGNPVIFTVNLQGTTVTQAYPINITGIPCRHYSANYPVQITGKPL